MKTFSDQLDTEFYLKVKIRLEPVCDNGTPRVAVWFNQRLIMDTHIDRPCDLIRCPWWWEPLDIRIQLQNKIYDQHKETAVIIQNISVDGIEIVPRFCHLATYDNDHQFDQATNYLGFNGVWSWTTDRPFYQWLHKNMDLGLCLDADSGKIKAQK